MAADRDLSFNVAAIDRTAKSFEKIALRLEKLESKLDKLDRKRVDVDVDVDTDRATAKLGRFTRSVDSNFSAASALANAKAILIFSAIAAALLALPPVAAVAAAGIVLAFGAGLAGIGIAAAAQDKKIRKLFGDLGKDLGKDLRRLAEPFEGTLRTVAAVARDVFDSLNLGPIFEQLAPALSRFTRRLGDAFKALAPALGPITTAFEAILDKLGPQLEPLFASIGDALTELSDAVNDNADVIAAFIAALLQSIPFVIRIIAGLTRAFGFLFRNFPKVAASVLGFVKIVVRGLQLIAQAALSSFGILINGAAALFGWVPGIGPKLKSAADKFNDFRDQVDSVFDSAVAKIEGWQESLDKADKVIKLRGNIRDLEGKLAEAKRKLDDPTLTKAQKKEIRGDISDLKQKIADAKDRLAVLKPATVKDIKGNIRDLESKISTAKRKLKDPTLTKAQTKRIRGNIKDLREKVNKAKAKLAELRDKTITIRANFVGANLPSGAFTPGARVARAHGGQVMSGRSYLVGERGPELFTPGSNGFITANDKLDGHGGGGQFEGNLYLDSGQFLGVVRGEIAEQDRSKKTRALAGAGANR